MKKIALTVGLALFSSSLFHASAFASSDEQTSQQMRMLVQSDEADKLQHAKDMFDVRWDFGDHGFSADLSISQLKNLQNQHALTITAIDRINMKHATSNPTIPSLQETAAPLRIVTLSTGIDRHDLTLTGFIEQCKDFSKAWPPVQDGACQDQHGAGTLSVNRLQQNLQDSSAIDVSASKLWVYKVSDSSGYSYMDDLAAAIYFASTEAANTEFTVLLSSSLDYFPPHPLLTEAIEEATRQGVLFTKTDAQPTGAAGTSVTTGSNHSIQDSPSQLSPFHDPNQVSQTLSNTATQGFPVPTQATNKSYHGAFLIIGLAFSILSGGSGVFHDIMFSELLQFSKSLTSMTDDPLITQALLLLLATFFVKSKKK
ncbi:S8/S53 family peptidase [Thalassobacillus sp. CUG 92003]|uniref:S8/S53 family peptidase n=1 Tax=Thalassobacillus sp. CUG 92003 TaxID=2736641 RepID=UPI0015E743D4|nr:S8/S53 family peptidase [Thalassobacillus sp. CUG 92003]